ncbi:MAG TPA: MFS transporter [Chthoniobacteraceae bacterium]|jgi:MFS family permease|nr:MFS transporter [Chthoniobacteraceae bacterium]
MKLPAVFAPLRHGAFARYMTGEFISMIGTWMQVAAQGWLLTELTPRPQVLGWLTFTSTLPMLALTLIGGRVADRHNKRNVLFAALAVQFTAAAGLGWLVAGHQIAIWHIFAAAVAVGLATAFETPAVSAFVPELVPKEDMAGAIAIDRSSFHATRLIGPFLGGYLMARYGVAAAYYLNAVSFLALGAALCTIRGGRAVPKEAVTPRSQGISEGLAYVRKDEPTRIMIGMMSSLTAFVSPFVMVTLPFYVRKVLLLKEADLGSLLAISGSGSLVGSFVLLTIPRGRRSLALKGAAVAITLAICGMAAADRFATAAGSLVLLTIGLSLTFGTANIVIQERAPDEMRGRVSSISALSFFGTVTFSGVLITYAIDLFGMRPTLVGGAVGYALAATILLWGRERLAGAPRQSEAPAASG